MSINFLQMLIGSSPGGGAGLEAAWAAIGRLFASGAAAELLGGLARGGAGNAASNALDILTDIYFISGSFPGSGQQQGGAFHEGKPHSGLGEDADRALKSHGFILQQLSANKHEKGIEDILTEYRGLGANLPGDSLLRKASRNLYSVFRRDQVAESVAGNVNPLATALGEAKSHLETPRFVNAYNEALEVSGNRSRIEKMLADISKFDWKAAYEKAERSGQLKLGFNGKHNVFSKAQQWSAGLSGMQKTGLAVAVVTGIGLGAYVVAKIADKRASRNARKEEGMRALAEPQPFTERVRQQQSAQPSASIG